MTKRKWSEKDLYNAVAKSRSIRQVLHYLHLKEAGGNYEQIKKYITQFNINTAHFLGRSWSKELKLSFKPKIPLLEILKENTHFQSYKLKKRLISVGLKHEYCELCGWAKMSQDGRIPLELDHINGNKTDNTIENLRILCPNCHSLQPTHRGLNSKNRI